MHDVVFAQTSIEANVKTNQKEVKVGEQVEVTLRFSEYKEVKKGINAYKATLIYDKEIFEEVLQDDFVCLNHFENLKYNQETGEFIAIKREGSKKDEDVVKIRLKVKKEAPAIKTEIQVKSIVASEGRGDLEVKGQKATVSIIKNQTQNPSKPTINKPNSNQPGDATGSIISTIKPTEKPNIDHNDGNNQPSKGENISDEKNPNQPNIKDENGTKNEEQENTKIKIPKTVKKYMWLFILLVVENIAVIFYLLFKRRANEREEENKNNNVFMSFLIIGLLISQCIGTCYASLQSFSLKGELNGDNEVNYRDVSLLQLHLIHQQTLPKERLENADINSDGKITVTDLTLLVQKLEKTLDYKVTLSDRELVTYYPMKNEEILLSFFADVSYGATIEKVVINGEEKPVIKEEDTLGEYKVKVNTEHISGIKDYHFTEVILSQGKRVAVDYKIKVDVLKDKPYLQNFVAQEDINEGIMHVTFDLIDLDCSLKTAKLEIRDASDQLVDTRAITLGKNEINLKLKEKEKYQATFIIGYDLDTNQLVEHVVDSTGREYFVKELMMLADYQFTFNDLKTYKENMETDIFVKGEEILLSFASTNASKYLPNKAVVDGKEYNVEKVDQRYRVHLDPVATVGEKEFTVEAILLENGRKFELEENNTILVQVIKKKPTVENFTSKENVEDNTIQLHFDVYDIDQTITSASVLLLDATDTIIASKNIDVDAAKGITTIEETLTTKFTSKYRVKVIANYNQTENQDNLLVGEVLFDQEIKAEARAKVKQAKTNKSYVEKGKEVEITYDIETNQAEKISKIRIGNIDYNAKAINGEYQITVQASEKSGIEEFTATKVIYSSGAMASIASTVKVDVLKEKPAVTNYRQQDSTTKDEVSIYFQVEDPDASFRSGKLVLTKEDGTKMEIPNVKVGQNCIDLVVEQVKKYKLEIMLTYDLDTNSLEGTEEEDNRTTEVLKTQTIQLIRDYQLTVDNLNTYSGETQKKYFHKNEEVRLKFDSTNVSEFVPEKVIISKEEYLLTKNGNTYEAVIGSSTTFGVRTLSLEKLILSNGKELEVSGKQIQFEILKTKPSIKNFSYQEGEDTKYTITFDVMDEDSAIQRASVIIQDEYNQQVKTETIRKGKNTITFALNGSERYSVEILADYDLDTNALDSTSNAYQNERLLREQMDVSLRLFEMKDIKNVILYQKQEDQIVEVSQVKEADLQHLENYLVRVDMKELPSFYATIEEYKIENQVLKFVLSYENIVQYKGDAKQNKLEVTYGSIDNEAFENIGLQDLIAAINANPSGTFTLDKDYDMSTISTTSSTIITPIFTGTINGNGHTISNVTKPLFNSMEGATIENLVIQNASVNAHGVLAQTISASTIRNVHLQDIIVQAPDINGTGSLAGVVKENSLIENCSATHVHVGTAKRTGGFIGQVYNSVIRNSYVEGTVSTDNDGSGGFIGETPSITTLENVYADVQVEFGNGSNAGIVGWSVNVVMKNALSLAVNERGNYGFRVFGYSLNGGSRNVYELSTSNMASQASNRAISEVTEETLKTKDFYTKTLGWSEEIWDFTGVETGKRPTLRGADPNYKENIPASPQNSNVTIPDYARLRKLDMYNVDKEIAYHNMYKLMPFYDAKYYVVDGNKIGQDHILNQKIIKEVFAYDENGDWVVALSNQNPNRIRQIRLLFTDNETVTYSVHYRETAFQVAQYEIEQLGIDYSYDKYVVDTTLEAYKQIIERIKSFDFATDLAVLTTGREVRTVQEHFRNVQEKADVFTTKLLANTYLHLTTDTPQMAQDLIVQELSTHQTLERLVYAYNHFHRFYDIAIGGINLSDVVFFDGNAFGRELNAFNTANTFVDSDATIRSTNRLTTYYESKIRSYTKLSLMDFLEFYIKNMTIDKYKQDPASWIVDTWDGGVIYEQPTARYPEIRYRVWDHFKGMADTPKQSILMLLSYHYDDMYLLGVPGTILIGNLRMYFGNNYDTTPYETRLAKLKAFATPACIYFDTVGGVVKGSKGFTNLMNFTQTSFDSTHVRNWSNVENTPNPFKHYYEPMNNYITTPASSAAFANTAWGIWWVNSWALTSFNIFTHESAHNTDDRIFFEGQGSRFANGSENYTNDFLSQYNGTNTYVPNYVYTNSWVGNPFTSNLSYKRIDTREKIQDYYKKMFDTYAFMDYLEAQAFLEMTPEEQAKLATIVTSTNGSVAHTTKTKEEFAAMHLQTIEDLWDNQIVNVRAGVANSLHNANWFLPSNENGGMAKSYMILHSYQFMGDFGFGAYALYNSHAVSNDLQALQRVSGDNTMTWKKYQLSRFENVKNQLENFKYFDTNTIIHRMRAAMQLDIENNLTRSSNSYMANYRNYLFGYLKRATGDFATSIFEEIPDVVHITNAQQWIDLLKNKPNANIIIDNAIDFSTISVEENTPYLIKEFTGTITGNNHKITGLTKPLFSTISLATIKDIQFENTNVVSTNQSEVGILAKVIKYSEVENITFDNTSVSGVSKVGSLAGTINNTTMENIAVHNATAATSTSGDAIGGVYGQGTANYMKNVHVFQSTLRGKDSVGGIAGYTNNNIYISEVSFSGTITSTRNGAGGLFGQLINSRLENGYTTGEMNGAWLVGGIAGVARSSKLDKVFSNMTIEGNSINQTGGLVGQHNSLDQGVLFAPSITNSASFGNVTNGYKIFNGSTKEIIEGNYQNNFELKESIGHETSEIEGIDFTNRITPISLVNINENFFKNTLGLDETIWDFSNVAQGGLPKLKRLDKNNVTNIMNRMEIRTIDDFLNISNKLDGDYILMNDLDFTGFTKESGSSVITGIFTGRLDGNNKTIRNLTNYSLFEQFRGTAIHLNISDFENRRANENFVAAFAGQTYNATLRDMKFTNITLTGANNVAVVSGMDGRENANSIFDRISVKNANVQGSGVYLSTFVGRKFGGKISNVYVEGHIETTTTENGGLVGAIHQNVMIENVVTNVSITKSQNTYNNASHYFNGGMIGNIYDTPSIRNSIALGNMSGYTDTSGNTFIPYKFTGAETSQVIAGLENCFEYANAMGSSRITNETNGKLNEVNQKEVHTKVFYKDRLHFDESIWNLDTVETVGLPTLR